MELSVYKKRGNPGVHSNITLLKRISYSLTTVPGYLQIVLLNFLQFEQFRDDLDTRPTCELFLGSMTERCPEGVRKTEVLELCGSTVGKKIKF